MREETCHDLALSGCTPEPLMAYLKALGVLRLLSEQKDPAARGWWEKDVFRLRSQMLFEHTTTDEGKIRAQDVLIQFFLREYQPTPIVAPWGARSGFFPGSSEKTAREALNRIAASKLPRLQPFQRMIDLIREMLSQNGLDKKAKDEDKLKLLSLCRNQFPDEMLDWLDTCFILTRDGRKFPPLLGTGGNEGSGSYVSGFAQQIVECLINHNQDHALAPALFGSVTEGVTSNQAPGHFSPNAAGGANAGQGFTGPLTTNAWDYLLCLEGSCVWASAAVRRMGQFGRSMAAFPFTVNVTGSGSSGIAFNDQFKPKLAKRNIAEMWLPLWLRPVTFTEARSFVSEGRATYGDRNAETGVDFARAVATLGIDRGINAFQRIAFLMRNGQNFLGVSLGRFNVSARPEIDLIREIESWIRSFRRAVGDKDAPPRFRAALNRIDSSIFEFCKYGGPFLFQQILVALGLAERELALTEGKVGNSKTKPKPLAALSPAWIDAANDNSPEFQTALSLASIHDYERKTQPIRSNLEAVAVGRTKDGEWYANWADKDRAVVWNMADLATNLVNVLQRRVMDDQGAGCISSLSSNFKVPLATVSAFLSGEADDQRIARLLWGLILIGERSIRTAQARQGDDESITRVYALLKLLFLPRPLFIEEREDGTLFARLVRYDENAGIVIRPEPAILQVLAGGRLGEACVIAMRRLRASGLGAMPSPIRARGVRDNDWRELDRMGNAGIDPIRLAAALLIPIRDDAVNRLVHLVIHTDEIEDSNS